MNGLRMMTNSVSAKDLKKYQDVTLAYYNKAVRRKYFGPRYRVESSPEFERYFITKPGSKPSEESGKCKCSPWNSLHKLDCVFLSEELERKKSGHDSHNKD